MASTSRRTSVFTESLIREMSRVAQKHGAINLSQGFPDCDPPAALVQAAKDAMDAGRHQYAVTWGAPELRGALARKLGRFTGQTVDPERELVVTCGATEAMMVAKTSSFADAAFGSIMQLEEKYEARFERLMKMMIDLRNQNPRLQRTHEAACEVP